VFSMAVLCHSSSLLFSLPRHSLHSPVQNDLSLWQPSVCLNFLDELFTWIRKNVVKDDHRWVGGWVGGKIVGVLRWWVGVW